MPVAVLGSGAWGTTLAHLLADKGLAVTLWEHFPERAAAMQRDRINVTFLPGFPLAPVLHITADLRSAVEGAEVVLFVTPTQQLRTNARMAAPYIDPQAYVICGSKGLEIDTIARVSQILHDELPPGPRDRIAVQSGPNLAREVIAGKPAASVIASVNADIACQARDLLHTSNMRVYSTDDVVGVEMGGAMKNVIAIAIGAADGLGYGDNTKAALMTRGLAEIVRLAVAEGGNPLTLAGLAGLGDLIATCSSTLSRNYSLGRALTETGQSLNAILAGRHSVAEGVMTARAALQMAARHGIEMPITQSLNKLFEGQDARILVADLLQRERRAERDR